MLTAKPTRSHPARARACWAFPRHVGPVCAPTMDLDVFDFLRGALASPSLLLCLGPTHRAIPRAASGLGPSMFLVARHVPVTATRIAFPRKTLRSFTPWHLGRRAVARLVLIRNSFHPLSGRALQASKARKLGKLHQHEAEQANHTITPIRFSSCCRFSCCHPRREVVVDQACESLLSEPVGFAPPGAITHFMYWNVEGSRH